MSTICFKVYFHIFFTLSFIDKLNQILNKYLEIKLSLYKHFNYIIKAKHNLDMISKCRLYVKILIFYNLEKIHNVNKLAIIIFLKQRPQK